MKVNFEYAKYSDVGSREINEDAVGIYENEKAMCFILCDGLGGHGMGNVASSLVTEVFASQMEQFGNIKNFLSESFSASQDILMAEQRSSNARQKMKTTAVACVTDYKKLHIGHIGDSRLYIFYKNKVLTRTLDHSIPQMLAIAKEIDESEIRNHPERNYVLKVLGIDWEDPMFELKKPISVRKCQALLLCSDGFWELIEENEMCRLLEHSESVEEWLDEMRNIVKKNGKDKNMDNNSAIAVWVNKKNGKQ